MTKREAKRQVYGVLCDFLDAALVGSDDSLYLNDEGYWREPADIERLRAAGADVLRELTRRSVRAPA